MTNEPPTTAELKAAFIRSGLWRDGWNYYRAITTGTVRWSLTRSALASRQTHHQPAQARLI